MSEPFVKSVPRGTRRVVRCIEPMECPPGTFVGAGQLAYVDEESFRRSPTVWDLDVEAQVEHFGRALFEPEPEPVRRSRDAAASLRGEWARDAEAYDRPHVSKSRTLAEPKV